MIVLQCPIREACPGFETNEQALTDPPCHQRYRGHLCANCVSQHYKTNHGNKQVCLPCSESAHAPLTIAGLCGIAVCALLAVVAWCRKSKVSSEAVHVAGLASAAAALGATVDELLNLTPRELEEELSALTLRPLLLRRVKKEWTTLREGTDSEKNENGAFANPLPLIEDAGIMRGMTIDGGEELSVRDADEASLEVLKVLEKQTKEAGMTLLEGTNLAFRLSWQSTRIVISVMQVAVTLSSELHFAYPEAIRMFMGMVKSLLFDIQVPFRLECMGYEHSYFRGWCLQALGVPLLELVVVLVLGSCYSAL